MRGFNGLSYLGYQEDRLKQFLNKNTGAKTLTQVDVKIITPDDVFDDEGNPVQQQVIQLKRRRCEVLLNTDDITDVLTKTADGIETQFGKSHLNCSDITLDKLEKITIHYDKCNRTGAGSYIELPKWVSLKKLVLILDKEDNKCFKYWVQCSVHKTYEKDNPERMGHYNELNDTINKWGCMGFPLW